MAPVPVTVLEGSDTEDEVLGAIAHHRTFAYVFILNSDGDPVEEYTLLTEDRWLPESFFRALIDLLKRCGLHWHDPWTADEGIKERMERKLYKGLQRLAANFGCPMWVVKTVSQGE